MTKRILPIFSKRGRKFSNKHSIRPSLLIICSAISLPERANRINIFKQEEAVLLSGFTEFNMKLEYIIVNKYKRTKQIKNYGHKIEPSE